MKHIVVLGAGIGAPKTGFMIESMVGAIVADI